MSAAMIASFAACSDDGSSDSGNGGGGGGGGGASTEETTTTTAKTEWTGDDYEVDVADNDLDTAIDTQGKTLKYMGFYDINPTNDEPERSVMLTIFEDVYGAKVEYIATTSATQFDDLATAIIGGTSPDIFIHSDRTFPYDISKNQFQPIDSLIDWTAPMWAEKKEQADKFMWNGEHYIAPFGYKFEDYQVLMYSKTRVEDEGLDDPYELYRAGEWDWDNFVRLQKEYQSAGNDRYGICGYWANAFVYTAGDPIVDYDGSKFTNNIYSANIERAQGVLEELFANNLVKVGWYLGDVFDNGGETLFYGMGPWAIDHVADAYPEEEIGVIPLPRNPEMNDYYVSKKLYAYMWVKGSDNADCVKAWFDSCRLAFYDPQYADVTKEKYLKNHPTWTSEIYDTILELDNDEKFPYAFDYGSGISEAMTGDDGYIRTLYECISNGTYERWSQARDEFANMIDAEIAAYN